MSTALAPIPSLTFEETLHLGQVLASSGYFTDSREAAQAVTKIMAGAELGFGPIASMTGIHIINGKPTLSANLLAAAVKRSGRYTYHVAQIDPDACELVFFESGREIGRSAFTHEDATAAGAFSGKNAHTWKAYTRNMLFARAMSNGVRWYCPDIFGGPVYTSEELGAPIDEEGEVIASPSAPQPHIHVLPPEPESEQPPAPPEVTAQEAEDMFWETFGKKLGGQDWNLVQRFLDIAQGKPTTVGGWREIYKDTLRKFKEAEPVRTVQEG